MADVFSPIIIEHWLAGLDEVELKPGTFRVVADDAAEHLIALLTLSHGRGVARVQRQIAHQLELADAQYMGSDELHAAITAANVKLNSRLLCAGSSAFWLVAGTGFEPVTFGL